MSDKNSAAISTIGQIAINVKDLNRATAFYSDKLGLRHLFNAGTMSFFDCGGVRLMLGKAEKPEFDHPSSILYFKVGSAQKAYDRLLAEGVLFEGPPHLIARMPDHELWMAFFRDSEENVMALMSEEPCGS